MTFEERSRAVRSALGTFFPRLRNSRIDTASPPARHIERSLPSWRKACARRAAEGGSLSLDRWLTADFRVTDTALRRRQLEATAGLFELLA